VAGGEALGANLAGQAEQRLEFHVGVAVGAGDGGAAGKILLDEGTHDAGFELFFEVDDIVRKIQMLGYALGVVNVVERAAAVLRGAIALEFREAALIPELHGKADDGAVLLEEDRGNGRRVDSTGHGYGDEAGSRLGGGCRESVELDLRGHADSILA
jgi:hypothetical protein